MIEAPPPPAHGDRVRERLEAENAALVRRVMVLGPALRGVTREAVEARRELARLRRENRALADRLARYELQRVTPA